MSLINAFRLLKLGECSIIPAQYVMQTRSYAVGTAPPGTKKGAKRMATGAKIKLPVQNDVNKLINYLCGSNIYKEGEDIQLKPDSEYPDWLWSIRVVPLKLEELDPTTKKYWKVLRKQAFARKQQFLKFHRL